MKKLLALLCAFVMTSMIAWSIGPPPPGGSNKGGPADYVDNSANHGFFHAHMYCPYGVIAGPDVFIGDYIIGETSGLLGDPYSIIFEVTGQYDTPDFQDMLDAYYEGFIADYELFWPALPSDNETGSDYPGATENYTEFMNSEATDNYYLEQI